MVVIKSKKDFDTKVEKAGDKLIVIDFYAQWCQPCKEISPLVNRLATDYKKSATVLKVDVDKNEDVADKYKISAMPTFVFMRGKKILGKLSGADEDVLKSYFSKFTK